MMIGAVPVKQDREFEKKMTELLRFKDRSFRMWDSAVSHQWLLFRSDSAGLAPRTIDVVFGAITRADVETLLREVILFLPSEGEAEEMMAARPVTERGKVRPWVMESKEGRSVVYARSAAAYGHDHGIGQRAFGLGGYLFAEQSQVLYESHPRANDALLLSAAFPFEEEARKRILGRFPDGLEDSPDLVLEFLQSAVASQDCGELRAILDVAFAFGLPQSASEVLVRILHEAWHREHTDVVLLLSELRDRAALASIFKVAQEVPNYLDGDLSFKFTDTCVLALLTIGTADGLGYVRKLSESPNGVIRGIALRRLLR